MPSAQGLFRVAPSASKLKKLKAALDCCVVDVQEYSADPHAIAGGAPRGGAPPKGTLSGISCTKSSWRPGTSAAVQGLMLGLILFNAIIH